MAAGSGLLTQFMAAEESTVGTPVAVTRGYEVDSVKPTHTKITKVSQGLRAGARGHRERNRVVTGKSAQLVVPTTVFSKGSGLWFKQAMGTTTITQLAASPTWRQIHLPGDLAGKSTTLQAGFAESGASGVVRPYTYNGCKVVDWQLGCTMDDLLKLSLTFDAWNWTNATSLVAASYLSSLEAFHWADLAVTIGGTPTTTAGRTTVAGGVTIGGLRGVTIKGTNGLRIDRRHAGGAGVKSEQLENAFRSYTGDLDTEFFSRTQLNDVFDSDASTCLQFTWTGVTSDGTGNFPVLRTTVPKAKFDTGTPEAGGPDIVDDKVQWTAYEDDGGVHPLIQVEYESQDLAP